MVPEVDGVFFLGGAFGVGWFGVAGLGVGWFGVAGLGVGWFGVAGLGVVWFGVAGLGIVFCAALRALVLFATTLGDLKTGVGGDEGICGVAGSFRRADGVDVRWRFGSETA